MASVSWSDLPPDILSKIAKILNTDVDTLRLRAVCSSWRSSVHPRLRPSSFPLEVPPLFSMHHKSILPKGGHYLLNYTTLYRLSPPLHGFHAGDPSQGWLFRALEVSPNRCLVLAPLLSRRFEPPEIIPSSLNSLDYRFAEVCKCYSLNFIDRKRSRGYLNYIVRKVVVLVDYGAGCDFVIVVLFSDCLMSYLKFGNKDWISVDTKDYDLTDVMLFDRRCYAIGRKGVLVSFDDKLNLTVVPKLPRLPMKTINSENYLVGHKSDLYVVSKVSERTTPDHGDDDSNHECYVRVSLQIKTFKKCNNKWKPVRCLGDDMLLSSDDLSVGLSSDCFSGMGANCLYVAHIDYAGFYAGFSSCQGLEPARHYGIFLLEGDRTSAVEIEQDRRLYWPPPGWLKKIAQEG